MNEEPQAKKERAGTRKDSLDIEVLDVWKIFFFVKIAKSVAGLISTKRRSLRRRRSQRPLGRDGRGRVAVARSH